METNRIMGGDAYRGDCPKCGQGLFGSRIHHCPKSERAIELAAKRKQKLTKQILKTTKDYHRAMANLAGHTLDRIKKIGTFEYKAQQESEEDSWDKIYQEWFKLPYEIDIYDWLKEHYSAPKPKKK